MEPQGFSSSLLLCLGLSFFFVISLYFWNLFPQFSKLERCHTRTVINRTISVILVCLASPIIVLQWIPDLPIPFPVTSWECGLQVVAALLLTMLWFLGPLIQYHFEIKRNYIRKVLLSNDGPNKAISQTFPQQNVFAAYFLECKAVLLSFSSILPWRNVVVAPIGEEWIFRGLMIPILYHGGFTPFWAGFWAPFFFGIAHLHHVLTLLRDEDYTVKQAILTVSFQFVYTTLFGWYSSFLFVQTNCNIMAPIAAHAFCNSMGFPDFAGISTSPHKKVISVAYVIGLVGLFYFLTFPGNYFPFFSPHTFTMNE